MNSSVCFNSVGTLHNTKTDATAKHGNEGKRGAEAPSNMWSAIFSPAKWICTLIHCQAYRGEKKKLYIQSRFPVFCYSGSHSCRQENAFTFVITLTTCMLVAGTPRARTPGSVFACGDYRSASGRLFNVLYKHAKCGLACGWMSDFRRTAPFDGCRDQKRQIFFYPESF